MKIDWVAILKYGQMIIKRGKSNTGITAPPTKSVLPHEYIFAETPHEYVFAEKMSPADLFKNKPEQRVIFINLLHACVEKRWKDSSKFAEALRFWYQWTNKDFTRSLAQWEEWAEEIDAAESQS